MDVNTGSIVVYHGYKHLYHETIITCSYHFIFDWLGDCRLKNKNRFTTQTIKLLMRHFYSGALVRYMRLFKIPYWGMNISIAFSKKIHAENNAFAMFYKK